MPKERIFAVDTESLTSNGQLKTVLTPVHYYDKSEVIETLDGKGMLEKLFASIFTRGWQVAYKNRSRIKRRTKRSKPGEDRGRRDGRRCTIPPALSVWFNLSYDFPRLCADNRYALRSVCAGADSCKINISERFDLEILKMHFGAASSFDWLIIDKKAKTVVRLLGIDLTGYWKMNLGAAAKSVGVSEKIDVESQIEGVYEKPLEKFTAQEWELFKEYAIHDSITTLELYNATALLLTTIDARVVKQTGIIPASAPGAAAKIVFAKAFDCHPEIKSWRRYSSYADMLGCKAYFGGRVFCTRPGIHTRLTTIDLKSAYPFQTALLPDPVTVVMQPIDECSFVLDRWIGQYGVLTISGESTDDLYPPFRVHDPHHGGRLQYVYGPFEKIEVTIPEIVIGVLRGVLRVDKIHRGVHMIGSAEKSFLRKGMAVFFAIKEDPKSSKALSQMAKLLLNSTYGKLVEVQCSEYMVAERSAVPDFVDREEIVASAVSVFSNSDCNDETYFGETPEKEETAREAFARSMLDSERQKDKGLYALESYFQALSFAGVRVQSQKSVTPSQFVSGFEKYKCGQYFMPMYAAQITGATSAMVGLMAECTGAFQGDTDSVHVQLPEGIERATDLPTIDRYYDIMARAGYPSPRKKTKDVSWQGGIQGMPSLGSWAEESTAPSKESLLVRPKVYSHHFAEGTLDKPNGSPLQYKQAKHSFSKFDSVAIQSANRDISVTKEERGKKAKNLVMSEQHACMREIIEGKKIGYDTKPAPRKLREAVRSGKEVGEFISRHVELGAVPDPNTWTDKNGYVRWLPLMATRQAREEQEAAE
jgi:hypothetical protein